MNKENKVMKFVKENKVKLALTAAAVAGVAVWAITKDKNSNYSEIDFPELNTGVWMGLFKADKGKYAGGVAGVVHAVDVSDLGKFGEALKTVESIDEHEPIRIIFGTERTYI
jgi:hypothetical protein